MNETTSAPVVSDDSWLAPVPCRMVDGVQVFDCRWPRDRAHPRAPWGVTLFGAELAAVQLGLRAPGVHSDTVPTGISHVPDTRVSPASFDKVERDILELFARCSADYVTALANPADPRDGGSVFYRPVAVAICNFGASVICDLRHRAVRRFS